MYIFLDQLNRVRRLDARYKQLIICIHCILLVCRHRADKQFLIQYLICVQLIKYRLSGCIPIETMLTMLYDKGKSTNWQIKKKVKFRLRQPSCQRIFILRRFLWSLLPFFYFCRFQSPHVLLNILLHVFKFY